MALTPSRCNRIHLLAVLWWLSLSLLSGCAQPDAGAVRFGMASAPISLDPRYATDATSARINRLIYQQLVDFDDRAQPVPALADWTRLSPTHYRFSLRGEPRFHDGARLTTGDVKATYDSVLDPAQSSPHRGSLEVIREIQVVDERRIDFHLHRPDALFPGYLVIGVVPAQRIQSEPPLARRPEGSGPFEFVAWPAEGLLRLRRLRDGQLFEFVHVADSTVRVLKLVRGELDLLQNDLPRELVRYLHKTDGIHVRHRPGSNFSYLGFNLDDPALADARVRRAIALAIDRAAIVRYVLGGETRLAASLLPPQHWAGGGGLAGFERDLARAKSLLQQAGYGEQQPLRLLYKTTSDPFRVRIATILQRQLAEAGIEVELRAYDWATFYADVKAGRFQLYTLSWVGVKSPDIFRYVFHSDAVPPAGANRGRFRDPTVDRLIERAEHEDELERRAQLYVDIQRRLLQALPYVPLWYEDHFYAARAGIEDYALAADGNWDALTQVRAARRQRTATR